MIKVNLRLIDFMDATPVSNADVTVTVKVAAKWKQGNKPTGEVTHIDLVGAEVVTQRLTSAADGSVEWSFDVSAAFRRQEQRVRQGAELLDVVALLSVHAAYSGIEGDVNFFSDDLTEGEERALFALQKELGENRDFQGIILIDFAKIIVGHTTPDSATLWFCLHGQLLPHHRCVCTVYQPESPSLPWFRSALDDVGVILSARHEQAPPTEGILKGKVIRPLQVLPVEFRSDRANTAVLTVNNLQPATKYGFALWIRREEEAGMLRTVRALAHGVVTTAPADSARLSLVFGSCHKPVEKQESMERWLALAKRQDYDLMVLLGDQIYGDEIEKIWRNDTWYDRYVKRYHQLWNYGPMREVLRRTSTYMVMDDHEVLDDWGTKAIRPEDGGDERIREAVEVYRIFQQSHNPGGYTGSLHYSFRWGPASFFVMDGRSVRSLTPYQAAFPILGPGQYDALATWAKSEETRAADVIFFVSPVPIAFLPVEEIRRLIKQLKDVSWAADTVMGFWDGLKKGWQARDPLVVAAFGLGGAIVGLLGEGATEKALKEAGMADLTDKDLADQWTYEPNQRDLARVLNCLFNLANDIQDDGSLGPRPRAVFVLSGDVHSGSMHLITANLQTPHLCALTKAGTLWHLMRGGDGKWSPFGDVQAEILREHPRSQNPGLFLNVDCVGIRGELHVIGLTQTTVLGKTQTSLVHTIRFSPTQEFPNGRWQQWVQVPLASRGVLPQQNVYLSSIKSASCAGVGDKLHVCVITGDGELWHGIRHPYDWGWKKTTQWPIRDKPGPIRRASCAGFAADLHVCAIANDGSLWHTIRRANGKWFPFGDVRAEVLRAHPGSADPGPLFDVTCSIGVAGDLHLCAGTDQGRLWHTIRRAEGTWSPFGDVRAEVSREHPASPDPGPLSNVRCSVGIAGELQVWGVSGHGSLGYTIRRVDGTWLPFEYMPGRMKDVACASVAGQLRRNPMIWQLTSSAISHPPTNEEIYKKVVRHIQPGKRIGWFDPIKTLGDFDKLTDFGDEPARFPLDDKTEHSYAAEFLALLVDDADVPLRNFGRVGVERVREDRRIYRFYLSIEGQARSLWRGIELDLDSPQVTANEIPNGVGILGFRGSLTCLQVHPNAAWIDGWNFRKDDDAIQGAGDLNGDGIDEFVITSGWGIGVLYHDGNRWRQSFAHPNDTSFGGWRYNSRADRIQRLRDFDGDGRVEILITSDWGIGILKQQGTTFDSPVIHPAGTRFGGWLYSPKDRINAVGDFDGDGRVEILITSDWGIGILKQQGTTFDSPVIHPAGTRFGGWLYSPKDRINAVGDFDGDGRVEILITSDWGIGILKQQGTTLDSPVIHPAGTRFGGWLYSPKDRINAVGDFDGDGRVEILITSDWGIGILKQQGATFDSPVIHPAGTRFGGWLYSPNDRINVVGDFDGDGREEFLVTSPWGIGLLGLLGDSFGCLDLRAYGSAIGNWFLEATDSVVAVGNFSGSSRRELLIRK